MESPSTGNFMEEVKNNNKMKIMVGIDDSDVSNYALSWVLNNLGSLMVSPISTNTDIGTATSTRRDYPLLNLIHVQPPVHHYVYPAGPGRSGLYTSPTVMDTVKKGQEENSAALMTRALEMCRQKMVKAESLILTGDPKDMICEAVEELHVDLLVVGSRGLGRIKRAWLGSVSDYLTHHSKCPVLIVKPPKEISERKSEHVPK
ncbi:hypothetical protein ACFE04_020846 [Oxalis oulophora]